MKIVVFAGGVGTRLWPLSRKNTPKQFEKIIGEKSTLQETIGRLIPEFQPSDIYIATGIRYKQVVLNQLPNIPAENFIFEPQMRDVGPAIGLVAAILNKVAKDEPIAILWSDHLVKQVNAFKQVLRMAETLVEKKESPFVFIAQKPRFPNQNMGWIEVGNTVSKKGDIHVYHFSKLYYRPKLSEAQAFFKNEKFVWNLGYFVTTPAYLCSLFKTFVPTMYATIKQVGDLWGDPTFEEILGKVYPTVEKISFDDAILTKLQQDTILVISADLGWSDVGAWEALKEALSNSEEENVTKGTVILEDAKDSLVFNYTSQLIVGIDLEEMLVINTKDVLLVCPKTSVPKIKKLVEGLAGTPHEHLT